MPPKSVDRGSCGGNAIPTPSAGGGSPRGLFVTGTDTDVGKTAVAVAIVRRLAARGRRVGVYKPAASGVPRVGRPREAAGPQPAAPSDARLLWEAAGRPLALDLVCPQSFAAPLAPPHAAALEGRAVDEELLRRGLIAWRGACDVVIVEGAGGLYSPLGKTTLCVDLAADFALPLVVVDAARLGAIGRTLATVEAARARGLAVAAIVLSHTRPCGSDPLDPTGATRIARDAAALLASRLAGPPVGILAHGAAEVEPEIDWIALAGASR